MVSPGAAFLLAYLPARRLAIDARRADLDRITTSEPKLARAVDDARVALEMDSDVEKAEARLVQLARTAGVEIGAAASPTSVTDAVRPLLTTALLQTAWKAGEVARQLSVAVEVAARLASLRRHAPQDPDLRARATAVADEIRQSAAALTRELVATNLPLVVSLAGNLEGMVRRCDDLTPTTTNGDHALDRLEEDTRNFIEAYAKKLDVAPPAPPRSAPTSEETALLQTILAKPSDIAARRAFARLASARDDPRGELIELQLASDPETARIQTIIRSHPEWTTELVALGAREIVFAAGFPDQIEIDAETWLDRGRDLLAAAPIRRVKIRNAQGRTAAVVRSPLLATIEVLDLDHQGVTDEDLHGLAGSPHASRLERLDLRFNPITAIGIELLAASPHLTRLAAAYFDGNPADPTDRQEYYDETNFHFVPTEAGKRLEAKYGRLRWLHRS